MKNIYKCCFLYAVFLIVPYSYPLRTPSVCSPIVHRLFNGFYRRTVVEQPVNRRRGYEGEARGNKDGSVRHWHKKKGDPFVGPPCGLGVICTRFELVTSCLSSKRSKPTELTDHFLAICGCKSTTFFQTDKIIFTFFVYLQYQTLLL